MKALKTTKQHSPNTTRSNVASPVLTQWGVRWWGGGQGRVWDYKHGGQASISHPKKCLHCVATVTKQFSRFHLHLSSLLPACPTRYTSALAAVSFIAERDLKKKNKKKINSWLLPEGYQRCRQINQHRTLDLPTGSELIRPHTHSACPGCVTERSSQQNDLWRGDSCHTANQSLHPVKNHLPALYEEYWRGKYFLLMAAISFTFLHE